MLQETKHDYQRCLVDNFYDGECNGEYNSWDDFKNIHFAFSQEGFDDRYHFVFRYDIHKQDDNRYMLELCIMLQRKGIYTHLYIYDIDRNTLNTEVEEWLKYRGKYIKDLWKEVIE